MDSILHDVDRPNAWIGRSRPRDAAARQAAGGGRFVDDLRFPRMVHVAFLRSPHAHARIGAIDTAAAEKSPGVVRVIRAEELDPIMTPWVGVLAHFKGLKSAPQYPLARGVAVFQGEPILAVVAETRALAEDALALVEVDWHPLPAVTDPEAALAGAAIHDALGDNLAFTRTAETGGDLAAAFASAHKVVEGRFSTARHTGVTLEPRGILADWNRAEARLTVHHGNQAPHMMKEIFCRHLNLPEESVRVICPDVGGSFGIKVHVYPDDMATVAIAVLLGRPVKFLADRLESFTSDIHAREHRVSARMAVDAEGRILALDVDDLTAIGPYSVYPRTSAVEGNQVVNISGGWYRVPAYRAHLRVAFTNKPPTCQYRAVGHPVAVAVTEGMADLAAEALGLDPAEFRRRNLIADDAYPAKAPSGIPFEGLSHHAALARLLEIMDYEGLRAQQKVALAQGRHLGIGIASFVEIANPSAAFYGVGGAPISAQDGCTVRLEPGGAVTVASSITEQGQGTEAILQQIAADALGVDAARVRVITGDTERTPYGGGTWASRGAGIGGEACLQAARGLAENIFALAGAVLQADPATLALREGNVVDAATGAVRMTLPELGRLGYFRGDLLPPGIQPELSVTRHFQTRKFPFAFTNGCQGSLLEVDPETGFITLLKHWVVEDCGTVINPMLVDEQVRGGVVQGIGGALYEECLYDTDGNLLNGTMADYLVPMSGETPDIIVAHIATPTAESALGAKGAGEAGTAGAPAAIMNALNDALRPLHARLTDMPFTPKRVLDAIKQGEKQP